MENAQKAIMIGVGLFITIILITAVMAITGIGTGLLDQGQEQLGGLSSQLTSQLTAAFDNKQMSGAQVLSNVQKYYGDPNMVIALYNTKAQTEPTYATVNTIEHPKNLTSTIIATDAVELNGAGIDSSKPRPAVSAFSSSASKAEVKVVTTAVYQSQLITYNDSVVGIAFMRK